MKKLYLLSLALFTFFQAQSQDIGVTDITSPVTGCNLTGAETVKVKIFNYGTDMSGVPFNVSYTVNGGIPVIEPVIIPSFLPNSTVTYTFTNTVNLSSPGTYTFDATTTLIGDVNTTNDAFTGHVVNNDLPTVGGTVSGGTAACISGNSGTLTLSGHVGTIQNWEFSQDGGSTWINISNNTATQNYNNLLSSTMYRVKVQNGVCPVAYSTVDTVTLDQATVAGAVTGNAVVCAGSNSGSVVNSGKTGDILYWEESTNGGATWNTIANTSIVNNYTNITQTTRYRAIVQNGACPQDTTTEAIITVDPQSDGGTIAGSNTVCSGSNSGLLNLSGNTGGVIRWEYSTNNGTTWTNINNTSTTQTYLNLTATTQYRALVKSGTCPATYSDTATVTVQAVSNGGVINSSNTVCEGSNGGTLTLTGEVGSVVKWQSSPDGTIWTDISNTTNTQNYSNLTNTTYFRVEVQVGTCASAFSGPAIIVVDANTVGGTLSGSGPVCVSGNNGLITLSGNTGYVVQWEESTDGGTSWNTIALNNDTLNYNNVTTPTLYRTLVKNGTCNSVYSDTASLTIDQPSVGGSVASSDTVCAGSNSGTLTLSGENGSILRWQQSFNGGLTWANLINTTNTQSFTNNPNTRTYRAVIQNGTCPVAFSSTATITVNPPTVAGTLSGTDTVCQSSNSGNLTLSGTTGTIIDWESSVDNGATWVSNGNTTNTQSYTNLFQTTSYRVLVQSGVCAPAYSNIATITVDPPVVGGNVTASDTVCASANSGTLTLAGESGTIIRWERSINGGTTWSNIANTTNTHNYNNLTSTTVFRAVIESGSCGTANSGTATITVDPVTIAGTIAGTDTICASANSGTLTLSGTTGQIIGWETSIDNGTTWTPNGNTSNTENYTNLTQTTWYRVLVQSGICSQAYSNVASLTVDQPTVGGTLASSSTVCSGSNSGTLTLSGESGSIVNWESSLDGGTTWSSINNTTNTQNYNNLTATTTYRAVVQSGVCSSANSTTATITVDPVSVAGTVTGGDTVCANANSGVMTLSGTTGQILTWETSVDGGLTWLPNGNTAATEPYNTLTQTTWYRAIVQSGVCSVDTSSMDSIVVVQTTNGGNILALTDTVCYGANNNTLNLTNYTGVIQMWQFSTDGGNTWVLTPNNSASQTYNNLTTTTQYRVLVQNGLCPAAFSDTSTIVVTPPNNAGTIQGLSQVCEGSNNDSLVLTGFTGTIADWESSTDNTNWTSSGNTGSVEYYSGLTQTTYYRAIVSGGFCAADTTQTFMLTVNPSPVASFTSRDTCFGLAIPFNSTSSISSGSITSTFWNFGDGNTSPLTNPTHTYPAPGTYNAELIVTSNKNCVDTVMNLVSVFANPTAEITASGPVSFCPGSEVTLSVGFLAGLNYNWSEGSTSDSILVDTTGTYVVVVSDPMTGCFASDSIEVNVFPGAVATVSGDTSVSLGKGVQIFAEGGVNYSWTPIESLDNSMSDSPIASPLTNTTYLVEVSTLDGCSDTASVRVVVNNDFSFLIPNLITPNGDGYNDFFEIKNIELYPDNELMIFNRYGSTIYTATGYDNTWGGTYNGELVPDGTYHYVLTFNGEEKVFKGSITILRGE